MKSLDKLLSAVKIIMFYFRPRWRDFWQTGDPGTSSHQVGLSLYRFLLNVARLQSDDLKEVYKPRIDDEKTADFGIRTSVGRTPCFPFIVWRAATLDFKLESNFCIAYSALALVGLSQVPYFYQCDRKTAKDLNDLLLIIGDFCCTLAQN